MDFTEFKNKYSLRLDSQQEAAVQAVEGPVILLAVPGSGKTTVLVSRLGYMLYGCNIAPESILTMTYTVAAAGDMRRRFSTFFGEEAASALEFRTINGVCSRIIRIYEYLFNRVSFKLLDDNSQRRAILAELCRSQSREFATDSTINSLEIAITYVKNQMLSGEEIKDVKVEGIDFPPLYNNYCKTLRRQHLMDYDDQMVYALQILKQYPEVLEKLQDRYRYFCVDEAQDTSKIQHRIIALLSSKTHNIFMVGDEDQSIYGFRAAYPQALTQFDKTHSGAKTLYMEQNYRSSQQIVAAADKFIQKNINRHPKYMHATRGSGPEIKEIPIFDRRKQYRYLLSVAQNCDRETAVLYRDNDSALPLIDLLERSGIPYRVRQVNSAFFTNRIVKDISDIICLALDPRNEESFMNVYYKMGAGISRALAENACDCSRRTGCSILSYLIGSSDLSPWTKRQCSALDTHMNSMQHENAGKAVYRIVHFMGYGEFMLDRGMDTGRADILEAIGAEQSDPQALLSRLEELKEIVEQGSAASKECKFILSTVHASKGLEYERVFLTDVIDGVLPHTLPDAKATDVEKDAYEEERRLFYVGMTRARQELILFTFTKPGIKSSFAEELFPKEKPILQKNAARHSFIPSLLKGKPSDKAEEYKVGTQIIHKSFGQGRIMSRDGDIAAIAMRDGSLKRISLSTAIRSEQIELK